MQVASLNSALLASTPADVWQAVFTRSAESLSLVLENLDDPELYKQCHRLRLVCKHFNSLFEQDPQLSEDICLRPDYPAACLPSLFDRMQRNSGNIVSLTAAEYRRMCFRGQCSMLCSSGKLC